MLKIGIEKTMKSLDGALDDISTGATASASVYLTKTFFFDVLPSMTGQPTPWYLNSIASLAVGGAIIFNGGNNSTSSILTACGAALLNQTVAMGLAYNLNIDLLYPLILSTVFLKFGLPMIVPENINQPAPQGVRAQPQQ